MRLKHAEKDVVRLAEALKGSYCQFTRVEVVIAHSLKDSLRGFKQFTEQCDSSDVILVHFSGHAIFDEQLRLLCNDTDLNDLFTTALEIGTIKTILHRCRARYKVLILDCCHAAGAHAGALKGELEIRDILHKTVQGSAIAILSACSRKARTRELDNLDGGSGFLSWAIRAGCTTHFHEASSSPDQSVLSLNDLCDNWLPKALEYVNTTLSTDKTLPSPMLLNEQEIGYGSKIWLTDPPPSGQVTHIQQEETRRKYLENVDKLYSSVTLPIGPTEGFSLHAIFQPLTLRRDPLTAYDLERKQRRHLLGEQDREKDEHVPSPLGSSKKDLPSGKKQALPPVIAENGEDALRRSPQGVLSFWEVQGLERLRHSST